MLNITNQTICQVMASYYRCPLIIFEPGAQPVTDYLQGVDYVTLEIISERVKYNPRWIKLVLKPLSDITDADILKVAEIEGYEHGQLNIIHRDVTGNFKFIAQQKDGRKNIYPVGQSIIFNGLELYNDANNGSDGHATESSLISLQSYQYLQSQNYDLPHYLLGGKTLKEANLAIYQ